MGSLDGRTALVAGASRGIGEYMAKALAAAGAKVAVAFQQVGRDHEGRQGKDKVKSSVATLNGFMKMKRTNAIWKRLVRSILKGKGGKWMGRATTRSR